MSFIERVLKANIWKTTVVYFGGAWMIIESLNFLVSKYGITDKIVDVAAILIVVGLFGTITFQLYRQESNHISIIESGIYGILSLIAIFFLYKIYSQPSGEDEMLAASMYMPAGEMNDIAVLTLDNLNAEENSQYFAAGITEAIRMNLSSMGKLKIVSRNSIEKFENRNLTTPEMGTVLNVQYLLDGSIQRYDQKIRINVVLTNCRADQDIWSMSYDRDYNDLFTLQSDVAAQIAEELHVLDLNKQRNPIQEGKSMKAYEFYLKASEMLRTNNGTQENIDAINELFDKAILLDSTFALAYIGKVQSYFDAIFWGRMNFRTIREQTFDWIMQAVALDADFAKVQSALGIWYYYNMEYAKAEQYLQKAIAKDPNDVIAGEFLALTAFMSGNLEGAITHYKTVAGLDPQNIRLQVDLAGQYYHQYHFEKAKNELEAIIAVTDEDYAIWSASRVYAAIGEVSKGIQLLEQRNHKKASTNWLLGYMYGIHGDHGKAIAALEYNLKKREQSYVPAIMISAIYIGLSDFDNAIKWLQIGVDEGPDFMIAFFLKSDPKMFPIEDDPRFLELLDRIGIERLKRPEGVFVQGSVQ